MPLLITESLNCHRVAKYNIEQAVVNVILKLKRGFGLRI